MNKRFGYIRAVELVEISESVNIGIDRRFLIYRTHSFNMNTSAIGNRITYTFATIVVGCCIIYITRVHTPAFGEREEMAAKLVIQAGIDNKIL